MATTAAAEHQLKYQPGIRKRGTTVPGIRAKLDLCRPSFWGTTMKRLSLTLALIGSVLAGNAAFAQQMTADDLKWINQCIGDNKNEGAKPDVVRKYCICMNEKMDNNETQSITQWEKTHPKERKECDRVAGWK
jgi:hypothetical protein